jgi:hydrophobe/amphiphile efflux-1 (HAE1) family protein
MKITELAIKRPVAVTVLFVAVFVTGLFSLTQLDVNYLPDISYPMVKIHAWWRGATADDIETNVADPLEEVIATVDGLDYLESSSIEGMYTLLVNFSYGINVEVAFQDVVAAMGRVTKKLPKSMDPPVVIKADPSQLPVIEVMITSDRHDLVWLRDWTENWLFDRLTTVDGTAGAEVVGGMEREIRIHLDPERLQAFGISPMKIVRTLHDENLETFAGRVTIESREIIARTMGEFDSLDEIRNVVVGKGKLGEEIYIKDVAKVEDSHEEMRINTHFDGKPCIEFKVLKQYAANAVSVANGIKARLKELKKDIPEGISFGYVEDESTYVMGAINSVQTSALLAALLVIFVVYFFLGNWRQVLIMVMALPITLLANFALMKGAGFSINVFSLGGLVVALGVILDNSIVVLENISRLREEGKSAYAFLGTKEVSTAIIASTLTFLAIFLPFIFVPGMSAILFKELVLVVAGVVVISLLVSLTLTPLLSDRLLKSGKSSEKSGIVSLFDSLIKYLIDKYLAFLRFALKHKVIVIMAALALFVFGLVMANLIGSEFLPKLDDGRVMVKLKTPSGTSVGEVEKILAEAEKQLEGLEEIESIFRLAGGRVFGLYTLEVGNEGNLNIQLVPKAKRNISTQQFIRKIRPLIKKVQKRFPGAKMPVKARRIKGLRKVGEQDVEVNVKGTDAVSIFNFAEDLASRLSKIPGLAGVNVSMDMTKPEYRIHIDRAKASAIGISVSELADTMKSLVQGKVGTQFAVGTEYYPIRVMVPEISLNSKTDLEKLIVATKNGAPVFLKDVAQIKRAVGPVEISREDQVMRVIVRADASGITTGEALALAEKAANDLKAPSGVSFSMGSEARLMAESQRVMGLIIGFALLFAYVILAIQFESFKLPFLIIINVPLTLTGTFIALFLANSPIGVTVQIGVLVMMGGVTSQGVVLLTLVEEYRQKGMKVIDAVLKAVPTRVRPILMTQFTTVLGLVPLAMNLGEGGDMLVTMAIGVIGGLLYSLPLSLIFLPAAYATINNS